MDELKLLIEMVTNLPSLAVWVLVGYLVYKVTVVGSIYGVIRLCIVKLHDWKVKPKVVQMKLGASFLKDGTEEALQVQILRLANCNGYINMSDVIKLQDVIDTIKANEKERLGK